LIRIKLPGIAVLPNPVQSVVAQGFEARRAGAGGMPLSIPHGYRQTHAKNEGGRYAPIIRFNRRANTNMKNGRPWRPPVS
jgi:hypothetical protein